MSYAAEGTAIRTRLVSQWSTTPIAWPNRSYTPTQGTPFVRLTLRNGTALQPALGLLSHERVPGVALIEVYVPADERDNVARSYVDSLTAIFRRVTVDDLVFLTPSAREKSTQEAGWYSWLIECPYYREETVGAASEVAVYGNQLVTQAAHGLAVGDWIKAAAGTYGKAQANAEANLCWPGVVVQVVDTGQFRFAYVGKANLPAHGYGTAGTKLYLSQATAGAVVTSEPSTGWVQQVGKVIDANHVDVQTWPAINKS